MSRWSAIALGASIPVSTALDNVLLVLMMGAWLISGQVLEYIKILFKIKYLQYSTLFFLILAFGTLHGESALREAFSTLSKYADVLCIPVIAMILMHSQSRTRALYAFAISSAVVVVLSYLIHWGALPKLPFITGDADSPTVFKQKITHSILLAYAAFLFIWLGARTASQYLRWIWIALAALAALNITWLVKGATGYLTLGALAMLLAWHRLGWRGTIFGALGVAVLFAAFALVPSPFQERVRLIAHEMQQWSPDQASPEHSSTGMRLEFYHNTVQIIAAHPLAGVGTGSFARAYARQVEGSGRTPTHNPHNEFLHVAAQAGVIGLAALLALFWQQWRLARLLESPMEQALVRALVFTFVVGCLVNSLLLDHAEGLFYAWMSGLLCAGIKYAQPDSLPART